MTTDPIPVAEHLPILLRAFAEPATSGQKQPRRRKANGNHLHASEWSLVFDCETTTDPGQALRFGFCRVYRNEELRKHICFYRPDGVSKSELALIKKCATTHEFEVMPTAEFIDKVFYKYGYHLRAMIVGFNLPFDLSRLAIGHSAARPTKRDQSMYGGFSLKLSPLANCPPIQFKHQSRYVSLLRFAGYNPQPARSQRKRGERVPAKRGYFLDLRTLAAALFSRSFSLASLAQFVGAPRKLHTNEHGKTLTAAYLDYARQDVETTWECFLLLRARYMAMGLNTPVNRIFSEASIGKAYFDKIGIMPWLEAQPNVSGSMKSTIMSTFYGGRSEVKIRREMRQVILCDFLSMYPTVCTLMKLWPFVIAQGVSWKDGTAEVRRLLKRVTLEDLQIPSNWQSITALVQVQPNSDIFPVRAAYKGSGDGTIGANYVSGESGVWFTLADCIASQVLTGKQIRVIKAFTFAPLPAQAGLQELDIPGGVTLDPYTSDLYKELIQSRQGIKRRRDSAKGRERDELDVQQNTIKIATSATSYGIFAEINVNDRPNGELSRIFGACDPPFTLTTSRDEKPGRFFHPLLATSITGAARLMLAIAERLITDAGLEWAFCDTDSMAIAKPINMPDGEFQERVRRIVNWFQKLNPYNFGDDILKIEDVNFDLRKRSTIRPLFVWAVSAKRYVLFNIEKGSPVIRKASAHGLGHFQEPYSDTEPAPTIPKPKESLAKIGVRLWQHDLWWTIAKAAIDGIPDHELELEFHAALKQPAISPYAATTPRNLNWFKAYNSEREYCDKVKPMGFVNVFSARRDLDGHGPAADERPEKDRSTRLPIKPVAPFERNPTRAAEQVFDRNTGERISIDDLRTYKQALSQYHLHPEDKFHNGDYLNRGATLRRHIFVSGVEYIGKESNKWEEQFFLGADPEQELRYGVRPATRKSISRGVKAIVASQGLRDTATRLKISRGKLSELLKLGFGGCKPEFMQRISGTLADINSALVQENRHESELLKLSKREIRENGISNFARQLEMDSANLAKMLSGARAISPKAKLKLQALFGLNPPNSVAGNKLSG